MALGQLPGFRVDRTGAALLGTIALIVSGEMSMRDAWRSIDYNTMALLFGLMIVSGSFAESGFYTFVTRRVAALRVGPRSLLGALLAVVGGLSALLTNDVVAVAMAPLLVAACEARRLNPVPFLLGLGFGANAGSVATLIGSPQNMIIGQRLDLSFVSFTIGTAIPAIGALLIIWAVLAYLYRDDWTAAAPAPATIPEEIPFDPWETWKAGIVTLAVLGCFVFTDWPRHVVALAAGGVLLMNRKIASTNMLRHVDGDLLVLLVGLFVVNAAFAQSHLPDKWLADLGTFGIRLDSMSWLFLVTAIASDTVGNTPAVMLLVPHVDTTDAGIAMALASGLSSNIVIFGSLATIIVADAAAKRGIPITFRAFTRAGVPVTLGTLLLAYLWLLATGG